MPGGHSGEVIPVPIPNTEVKLSYADDTAFFLFMICQIKRSIIE